MDKNTKENSIPLITNLLSQLNKHFLIINDILTEVNAITIQLNDIIVNNNISIQNYQKQDKFWDKFKDLKLLINDVKTRFDKYKEQTLIQEKKKEEPNKEKLSEEGLEKEAILTVMNDGKCSREAAIKALRNHDGDPVEALLEIGFLGEQENNNNKKNEEINNIDKNHEEIIQCVIEEGKVSREVAIKALEKYNWDPVNALMEVGN